jgi:hypothetical protein
MESMQRNSGRPRPRKGDASGSQSVTIESYLKKVTRRVSEHPLVLDVAVRGLQTSLNKGYTRLVARLIDRSQLHIFEYVDSNLRKILYAYHYQDPEGHLIFRYDNEPHYPELATFPHHKHLPEPGRPVESIEPSTETVLEEIARSFARRRRRE